jgi:hypothetical protein
MAFVTAEVTWLRWLLKDFGVSVSMPTSLMSDNTGVISITRDLVKHELTKHIGVHAYYTRSQIHDSVIALQYVFRALAGRFLHKCSDSHPLSVLPLQTQCC